MRSILALAVLALTACHTPTEPRPLRRPPFEPSANDTALTNRVVPDMTKASRA